MLILIGCFTKSAQVPFHGWLPGAMSAPTPVSAYLHSATMVKAGVFLVARLSPHLAELGPWKPLTLTVGLATMAWGGYRALRQTDLKLMLAYGTVSQLGMLIAVFGAGEPKLLLLERRFSLPTPCSRRACSWLLGSSITAPAPVRFPN